MFIFLLLLIIILTFLTYAWALRKRIWLFFKLKCDLKSYPILGHMHLFFGTTEDQMTGFKTVGKEAIKHGGITRIWLVYRMYVVIADAELAQTIFKGCLEKADMMKLPHNLVGDGSIFASAAIWWPRRKLLNLSFAPKHVKGFWAIFDKNSRTMADQLTSEAGQGSFSVWKYVTACSIDSLYETTLDYHVDALQDLNQPVLLAIKKYSRMTVKRIFAPWTHSNTLYSIMNWEIKNHIKTLQNFVDEIIKAKRKAMVADVENEANSSRNDSNDRRNTILDQLINTTFQGEGLSDMVLREELLGLMLAGSDTMASGIAFVLMMLAKFQDVQEKVYKELHDIFGSSLRAVTPEDLHKMEYLNDVIKETLRLYPPVPIILRKTDKDIVLPSGLVLPKDVDIIMNIWAINRNPQYWGENAEQFDPSRFSEPLSHPVALATFSYGVRNCIGYQYAYMSLKIALSTLLRRFRVLPAQESDRTEPLRVKIDVTMKEVKNFQIKLEKRTLSNKN